jgi:undecaprenyl-diphosphatase
MLDFRVTYTQGVVLGIVQGLTEFIPVSSSGHLILVPHVFGWPDQGLAFDAAMHLGTLAALIAYFRHELIGLVTGRLARRLGVLLVLATVPAGIAGVVFGKLIEERFRSPLLVATSTALWAIVMAVADRRACPPMPAPGDPVERVKTRQGLTVGFAQVLALVPGTSRSGVTITAGLFSGLDRATAARFSFLLGIPITAGAGLLKTMHLLRGGVPPGEGGPLIVAVLAAFLSGWAAVWFLVTYLGRRSLMPFVIYRVLLAAIIFAVFL